MSDIYIQKNANSHESGFKIGIISIVVKTLAFNDYLPSFNKNSFFFVNYLTEATFEQIRLWYK